MSQRQAETRTESAPNKGQCAISARTLFHAASSSEQKTNRLDSNVQTPQASDAHKTVLSSSEKSVAMKYEESEDHTLLHQPHEEPYDVLKNQSSPEYLSKLDTSSLRQFPVNQALWRIFMNPCMWSTANPRRRFQTFLERKVQRIQTVFETMQAQIGNLKLHDREMNGSVRTSGLDRRWLEDVFVC